MLDGNHEAETVGAAGGGPIGIIGANAGIEEDDNAGAVEGPEVGAEAFAVVAAEPIRVPEGARSTTAAGFSGSDCTCTLVLGTILVTPPSS